MLALVARGTGWKWPLGTLEVWEDTTNELVAELPAALVLQLVQHFLHGAELQARVHASRDLKPPMPAPSPIVPRKPLRAVTRRLRGYTT